MTILSLTKHAEIRCQQRGIPPFVVDLLLQFGRQEYSSGAEIIRFDRKSRKAIRRYTGGVMPKNFDKYDNAYVVFRDGHVLTAGHRYKAVKRK